MSRSGQMTNGRQRCWRQGSPSTRERSWLWTSRCVHPSPRQAWRAQGPQLRMVQCWSEPVPTKRRSSPSSSRETDVIWWWELGDRGQMEHRGNHFCRHVGGRSRAGGPVCLAQIYSSGLARWTRMLAVSCGRSFADSLVSAKWDTWRGTEGARPDLADLFDEQ